MSRQEATKEFKFNPSTTYHDILALALAQTSINKFKAEAQHWHKALHEICQRFQGSIPELDTIFFEERYEPRSETVYELLMILSMSHLIELSGPNIQMSPEMKKGIKNLEEERLSQYQKQIAEMSTIFEKHLA